MVNQSAIGQYRSGTSRQAKGTRIDGCDETATKKDASRGGPIEKVMLRKRANELQNYEADSKADSSSDTGCPSSFSMSNVRFSCKLDEVLKDECKCHRSKS